MSHLCYNFVMERIKKKELIVHYIKKYKINNYFSFDITDKVELLSFQKNELIISQGYPSQYLYMLVRGEISLYSLTEENGKSIALGSIKPFHFIGEMASLQNKEPYNNVQANTDVYCLALSYHRYRKTLLNDPRFLRYIIKALVKRCENLNNKITAYQNDSSKQMVAKFILLNNIDNILNTSIRYCADSIGCSYRHVIRVLNQFCEAHILEKQNKKYHIIDKTELEKISSSIHFSEQEGE